MAANTTDKQIKALKPREKQYSYTISLPNKSKGTLLVLVNPGGKKSFKTRYRYDGKQKGFSIGTYPSTSLHEAVKRHNEAMTVLDSGIDPKVHFDHKLTKQKSVLTIQALFDKWFNVKQMDKEISSLTIERHKWRWEKYLKHNLGKLHVDGVERLHISYALEEVQKKSREEARKSLSTLNQMFKYAVATGRLIQNPTLGLASKDLGISASPPRKRWLKVDELILLWKHLDETKNKYSFQSKTAIRFAILTGARRSEITNLTWDELDLDAKVWQLPANRSKNKKSHTFYLSELSLSLLKELHSMNLGATCQSAYVFRSTKSVSSDRPLSKDALSRCICRISKVMDIKSFTFHDLRRSAASNWSEKLKASSDVIEKMLNHAPQNRLVATYQQNARSDDQKEIWLRWGTLIQDKLNNDVKSISFTS